MVYPENDFGLPYSIESEQSVLGAILLDRKAIDTAMEHLQGGEFYDSRHGIIYEMMCEMREGGEVIDLVTLTSSLQGSGKLHDIGGMGYLARLQQGVPTADNVLHYIETVKERFVHRSAIITLQSLDRTARQAESSSEVIAALQEAASSLSEQSTAPKSMQPLRELLMAYYENLEYRYHTGQGGVTGIPSGFAELDKLTAGFQKSDLIIIAARPSVGKTAFALNIAQNVGVRAKETLALFSLEMSKMQLVGRIISSEGLVDAGALRTARLAAKDWEDVASSIGILSSSNIFIDDTPGITIGEIRAKCRMMKREQGLGMILIDYLQLIRLSGKRMENRQQEVAEISRQLKELARELDVPVIALSQLSRGVEQRQDKRPVLSDLRESGSIEQDADIVGFLHREDYYDKETEKKNIIEIIIAKQRNGPVGSVELAFLKNFNKFAELESYHS
ncbi:replicative DNA helicase [Paenibacillaceae bacterium]|nr:replicative DNA helicase [Paenibacillaceae bacterium]